MTQAPISILALLNIGQAPRHDLSEAIERGLPADVHPRHAGALDGLDRAAVEAHFAPSPGHASLISRLADGGIVTLDAQKIEERLQQRIDELEADGVQTIVLLCTGEFPALRTKRAWLVEPDRIVCNTVVGMVGGARVGIMLPMPQQAEEARLKWRHLPQAPLFHSASPYAAGTQAIVEAARELEQQGAQTLVLDCMGYLPRHKDAVREAGCRLPVLVSGTVVAGALGAFL